MCDAQEQQPRRATRVARRRRAGFWLIMALVGSSSGARGVMAQGDFDFGYEPPQAPMRAGGGGGAGGVMGPILFGMTSFAAVKLFFSGRRKRNLLHEQQQEELHWQAKKREDIALIKQQFNQMEASLTTTLNEKLAQASYLEKFLYSLPDINSDGLITRFEFDKYMNDYKRSHPELTDRDLPRFEEMDHNNNGHINFHEWEEYQRMAMGLVD